MNASIDAAIVHYDALRGEYAEADARLCAENYLRRKEGIGANAAAELLADALASRATKRINAACAAITGRDQL